MLRKRVLSLAVLGVFGCGAIIWIASKNHTPAKAFAESDPTSDVDVTKQSIVVSDRQLASLKVIAADTKPFHILKNAIGWIDFNQNMLVQVFTPNAGRIIETHLNVGDQVEKGQTLFTVDSPDLLQAESALLASAGILALQSRTLTRAKQLLQTGGGAQRDVDQATSDQQTAEGNYKAARDAVRIFGKSNADIDRILADRKVDSTLIVPSPINGRVVARSAAPGLLSQPGTAPAPYTIADLSTMWMVANVIETDAPAYQFGQTVKVRVPSYPDEVFVGRVDTIGLNIDPSTHRQLIRSVIDDPLRKLRAGMLASFSIEVAEPRISLSVPSDAVVREGDGTMTMWVTTDDKTFSRRAVVIGIEQDGWRQILNGLTLGERYASTGSLFLSNKFANAASGAS